jgi:hypothetical protein
LIIEEIEKELVDGQPSIGITELESRYHNYKS